MALRIYNTITGNKEEFEPIVPGQVGIYCCGPTVYMNSHIGHMVGPVIFDTIKRYLTFIGYKTTLVVNITDVEDKLIKQAAAEGTSVEKLAEQVTEDYLANLEKLAVSGIDHMPRATDHIAEIIAITAKLFERGYAYEAEGDVYFDVTQDEDYGKLSHRDPEALRAGARIEPSQLKRNPGDFALWKRAKESEPSWDSPWGPGRPGWHIECSAMSMKILGETFDIHGGGLDLVFPHHENEIAQSESATGKTFARFWLHNGLLRRSGGGKIGGRSERADSGGAAEKQEERKMSKSKGNIVPVSELLEKHQGETVRFFLLSTHYRSPVDFSDQRIEEVGRGLQGFYRFFDRFERITGKSFYDLASFDLPIADEDFAAQVAQQRSRFLESMDDDFNTSSGIGVLFDLLRVLNGYADSKQLDRSPSPSPTETESLIAAAASLRGLSGILGVFERPLDQGSDVTEELSGKLLDLLVDLRQIARKSKNFELADQIRDRLGELGVTLEDRAEGTGWRFG